MSKGSWYRKVDKKKFDENYDRIFRGNKDVGDDRCDDSEGKTKGSREGTKKETEVVGEAKEELREDVLEATTAESRKEAEPFKSTDPILRSIEADHRRG